MFGLGADEVVVANTQESRCNDPVSEGLQLAGSSLCMTTWDKILRMIFGEGHKTQPISKLQIMDAFKRVKANGGSVGVDKVSIKTVDTQVRKYLYPLWNRLASGSYYPQPVRQVMIPKGDGKERALGIPTVTDMVDKQLIASEL